MSLVDATATTVEQTAKRRRKARPLRPGRLAANPLERPLAVSRRRDLTAVEHRHLGIRYWVVKDPIGLKYYRFPEEEYALLQMLDKHASLQSLMRCFEERFAPRRISVGVLQKFIGRLHERGLVIVDRPGQAMMLLERERKTKRRAALSKAANLLSIRFPGVDPERTLVWLNRWLGWVFSPTAAMIFALVGVAALLLMATNFNELLLRIPSLGEFFSTDNLFAFAAAMIGCKICHEFGHGLAAKTFGGECHRMGFMLLVFMPAMYCDVSDSWLLPSKWRRMVIAAAGVYIELILASFATFVWWFSHPGLLQNLALGIMVTSSISTLLVNANPLMRFDGYYALSDWLETPNLATRSQQEVRELILRRCFGVNTGGPAKSSPRMRSWLLGYGVASLLYRLFLVAVISIALHEWLEPVGLGVLADGLLVLALGMMFGVPAVSYFKFFRTPGRVRTMQPRRMIKSLAVAGLIAAFSVFVPLPRHVHCDVLLDLSDTQIVYADPGGRVEEMLAMPGDYVEAGQTILRLSNLAIDQEIARLETRRRETAATLDGLLKTRFVSADFSHEIDSHRDQVERFDDLLLLHNHKRSRLAVTAPKAGWVLPIPNATRDPSNARSTVFRRNGWTLNERNLGSTLGAGEWICQIGDPSSLKAVLLLDQSDCGEIRGGQTVLLRMSSLPMQTLETKLQDLAIEGEARADSQGKLEWDLQLNSSQDGSLGAGNNALVAFRAMAEVDNSAGLLRPGMLGRARVKVESRTLASALWKAIWEHLHF